MLVSFLFVIVSVLYLAAAATLLGGPWCLGGPWWFAGCPCGLGGPYGLRRSPGDSGGSLVTQDSAGVTVCVCVGGGGRSWELTRVMGGYLEICTL